MKFEPSRNSETSLATIMQRGNRRSSGRWTSPNLEPGFALKDKRRFWNEKNCRKLQLPMPPGVVETEVVILYCMESVQHRTVGGEIQAVFSTQRLLYHTAASAASACYCILLSLYRPQPEASSSCQPFGTGGMVRNSSNSLTNTLQHVHCRGQGTRHGSREHSLGAWHTA